MKLTIEILREPGSDYWLCQWQLSGSNMIHTKRFRFKDQAIDHASELFREAGV